ncbi:MAG: class I SAM-dependent methyltransferase [Desulfuromonadaceae bacterium]|nr:class I SAM-dependent methyltransferase [Desulfuromonas sp.]MDY0185822.1 class I SAM-dependent methyltransferase [Desulfuromonadaceae bacterium]
MELKVKDFNPAAATWDEKPRRVQLAADVAKAIRGYVPVPPRAEAMEFGCGTGLLTFNLIDMLAQVVAVDRAEGMLTIVKKKAATLGATQVTTKLIADDLSALGTEEYDFIYSNMVLHHLPAIEPVLERLVAALKPGGVLALSDLEDDDGTFHDKPEGVVQSGIKSSWLMKALERLGLINQGHTVAHSIVKQRAGEGKAYPIFLVWGARAQ